MIRPSSAASLSPASDPGHTTAKLSSFASSFFSSVFLALPWTSLPLPVAFFLSVFWRDFGFARPRSPFGRHVLVGGNTLVPAILRDNAAELGVTAPPEAFGPCGGGVTLDVDELPIEVDPGVEPGRRPGQCPPGGVECSGGRVAEEEQACRELEQDLRLRVTAHRAEHRCEIAVAGGERR